MLNTNVEGDLQRSPLTVLLEGRKTTWKKQ